MDIRIYRTWAWEPGKSDQFGIAPPVLVARDQLQYMNSEGEWKAVPVVEAAKPPHPDEVKRRQDMAHLENQLLNTTIQFPIPYRLEQE